MFAHEKQINDAKIFWNLVQINDVVILQNDTRVKGKIIDKIQSGDSHNITLEVNQSLMDVLILNKEGTPWQGFAIYKKS